MMTEMSGFLPVKCLYGGHGHRMVLNWMGSKYWPLVIAANESGGELQAPEWGLVDPV